MNRADLQHLTRLRLAEAKVLFDNRRYDDAYYLLGYAIECAFKDCIAKQTKRYDFPEKNVNDIYTHNLNKLLSVSGLEPEYRREITRTPNFELNWTTLDSSFLPLYGFTYLRIILGGLLLVALK